MPKVVTPKQLGAPLGMYSHGMIAPGGELVVVAGQVGADASGHAAAGDVVAQTKQAFANVRAVVEAAGCAMRDLVRLQTFLTRAEDIPAFMKARQELFPDLFPDKVYPPNTLLVVNRLVRPDLLVEIEAMAVRAPRRTSSRRASASAKPASARRRAGRRGRAS
jgi:enamine deaminase RidA (YjgF/YER057c/UK114 family)